MILVEAHRNRSLEVHEWDLKVIYILPSGQTHSDFRAMPTDVVLLSFLLILGKYLPQQKKLPNREYYVQNYPSLKILICQVRFVQNYQ